MDYKKIISTCIDVSQLLYSKQCTYTESEKILSMLLGEIRQQRENAEYETVKDFFGGKKSLDVSDNVITPLNHAGGY